MTTENTIDLLMDKDPLDMTGADIDDIIKYERKQRVMYEAGVKPKKEKAGSVNLDSVVSAIASKAMVLPAEPIKRRV